MGERNGVNGQTLRKQYKEKLSDYRGWNQLEHAEEYVLFPDNIGQNMSLDETCLSNGDVYTILTNKAAHGAKVRLPPWSKGGLGGGQRYTEENSIKETAGGQDRDNRFVFGHDADCQDGISRGKSW